MASISIMDLWNAWNIRCFVILSLLLQVFLILFAPLRKKIANHHIAFLLWLAYLMADWVATFAIGLISHKQGNSSACGVEINVNGAIQAFWASFLLLHLGGPDTIIAFSLEDRSLWRRHLLSIIFQVGAAIYVFVHIFPNDKSLVIPTMMVFLVGLIRNAERILALNFSSLLRLRESMDPRFSEADWLPWNGELTEYSYSDEEAKLDESIVVKHAYYFFQIFNVFLADLIFTEEHRDISVQYFHNVSPLDALRVISVELQFMHDVLHTKASVIHSKCSYIFRFIALNVLVVAFILFNRLNEHLPELDIKITYSLLFGGIALDVIALSMRVFSDWTVGKMCNKTSSKLDSFLYKLASTTDDLRKARFATCEADPNANDTYEILDTPLIFRRWSESISACNLFSELWEESPRKMYKCNRGGGINASSAICSFPFRTVEKIIYSFHQAQATIVEAFCLRNTSLDFHAKYVSKNPFIKKLWIFIFKQVKHKSKDANDLPNVRKIYEARGDMFLECGLGGTDCSNLLKYVTEVNYDSGVICWHIATELWYNREKPTQRNEEREFSKILSDYMVYLLLNHPNVVFAVAGNAQITTRATMETLHDITKESKGVKQEPKDVKGRWMHLFEDPSRVKFGRSLGSMEVTKGFELAQEMERLGEKKWEVMSGVWVEMLTYAATHIRGEAHAQVLSKGGELLAFVWLLMAHFGCFYKQPWGGVYPPKFRVPPMVNA